VHGSPIGSVVTELKRGPGIADAGAGDPAVEQVLDPSVVAAAATPAVCASVSDRSRETTAAGVPWANFAARRAEVRRSWPVLWDLPVTDDDFGLLAGQARRTPITSVLDVGATDRRHRRRLESLGPAVRYASLDVDRTLVHDYHEFAELDRTFDAVVCLEVLEHVDPATGLGIVRDCAAACRPGGFVYLSVPNCLVPSAQMEFTHRTAITHLDLGALCRLAGLEVLQMSRIVRGSPRTRWIHRRLLGRWHRFMKTDFCASVACLARRPEQDRFAEVML
jgi:SAM-dependent methyltransferase